MNKTITLLLNLAIILAILSCSTSEQKDDNIKINSDDVINVDELANKTEAEIIQLLGAPKKTESVHPSKTPCPCPKNYYKDGSIEIVFINEKADWITVNNPKVVTIKDENVYSSVNRFDDYTYIKVKTK